MRAASPASARANRAPERAAWASQPITPPRTSAASRDSATVGVMVPMMPVGTDNPVSVHGPGTVGAVVYRRSHEDPAHLRLAYRPDVSRRRPARRPGGGV